MSNLESLRALAQSALAASEKATRGRWTWEDDPPTLYSERAQNWHGLNLLGRLDPDRNGKNNLDFICASRTSLPVLARTVLLQAECIALLRSPHDSHACERPDDPCYTCGKLAEFDAALTGIAGEGEKFDG